MCREVFELVQQMDVTQVELRMALQCAPVITGIKMSNLLRVRGEDKAVVCRILKKTEIVPFCLLQREGNTTFLLFRMSKLKAYLQESNVQQFLMANGYKDLSMSGILRTFQSRYEKYMCCGGNFPHEMGILLGYPIEDVRGFMEQQGKNYLYAGYWKVYADVAEKKLLFEAYESAKEALVLLVSKGYGIQKIMEKCSRFYRGVEQNNCIK